MRADEFRAPPPCGDDDGFVPAEECAQRMGITVAQVDDLVRRGALAVRREGWAVLVQPAIVNVTPRPEKPSPRRGSGTKTTPRRLYGAVSDEPSSRRSINLPAPGRAGRGVTSLPEAENGRSRPPRSTRPRGGGGGPIGTDGPAGAGSAASNSRPGRPAPPKDRGVARARLSSPGARARPGAAVGRATPGPPSAEGSRAGPARGSDTANAPVPTRLPLVAPLVHPACGWAIRGQSGPRQRHQGTPPVPRWRAAARTHPPTTA